ncbi:MAG: neutral/alkaline non-lysosomal ceramidase N-terminal domain-containing protein [Clostridia bacterium]|nr:neutral/alkaline non-lysosomal ceramidase N-terminal domain-containing protein [Clostridia bacterium]
MEKLYLGVARKVITPEIGGQLFGYKPDIFSESIEDDLTATAFYFKQGDKQALMISVTVCSIKTELAESIAQTIEEKFGIKKENCLISATHTHSGPNTAGMTGWGDVDTKYCNDIFVPQILAAVGEAVSKTEAVTVGIAHGESYVGINRRQLLADNRLILGQNKRGCFNPLMTVVSFRNDEKKVIANMIHYGAHGTAAGMNHEITRDWSGIMTDTLEGLSGGITAFFNGTEGDVGPRLSNGGTTGNMKLVHETGGVAARDAVKIYNTIYDYREAELIVSAQDIKIPLKKRMTKEEATALLEMHKDARISKFALMKKHSEDVLKSYEDGFIDEEFMSVPQTVIGFNKLLFVGFPFELFSEIGMRIDDEVKDACVLSLSNANGSEGYFVTEDAICRSGYEVDMYLHIHLQQYEDNADFSLMTETLSHIEKIIG